MEAHSTHIPFDMMNDSATHAYLAVTSLTSWSNSMTALHVGEGTAPLPTFSFITAAGAPRPSIPSLGVDLPSQVRCRSRVVRLPNHSEPQHLRHTAGILTGPSQLPRHAVCLSSCEGPVRITAAARRCCGSNRFWGSAPERRLSSLKNWGAVKWLYMNISTYASPLQLGADVLGS